MTSIKPTALIGVQVFDGERLSESRTVVIAGHGIRAADNDTEGASTIDVAGAVLLPGLIDPHVHLDSRQTLQTLAAWGITAALDMACWPANPLWTHCATCPA